MTYTITETVLNYDQSLLNAWKDGKKDWIPKDIFVPIDIYTQPTYHFGEYFTLAEFHKQGWDGTAFYALGDWELNNPKYIEGRKLINKYIHPRRLAILKTLRHGLLAGEPDLFLHKEDGSVLFLEVKKQSDRVSESQLICLAQIKSILECDIGVVYLTETNQKYKPKTYQIEITSIPETWVNY